MDIPTAFLLTHDRSSYDEAGVVVNVLAIVAGLGVSVMSLAALRAFSGTRKRRFLMFGVPITMAFGVVVTHTYLILQYFLLRSDDKSARRLATACNIGASAIARVLDLFVLAVLDLICVYRLLKLRADLKRDWIARVLECIAHVMLVAHMFAIFIYELLVIVHLDAESLENAQAQYRLHMPIIVLLIRSSTRFYALAVVLAVTSIIRYRRVAAQDKVIDVVTFVVLPLIVVHAALGIPLGIWNSRTSGTFIPALHEDESRFNHLVHLISTLDFSVFPMLAVSVLAWLGISSSTWPTETRPTISVDEETKDPIVIVLETQPV